MEDKIPPHGQEVDELKLCWNKCLDLERCDSVELDPVIRRQIKQNPQDAEETLSLPRQSLLDQRTLSHHKTLIETKKPNSISRKEYEHRIRILANQNAELLKVNKQWDQHFRCMKQTYENKQSKEESNQELHKIKEENCILKKQNHVLRKRNDNYESEIKRLNKVLLLAATKDNIESKTETRLHVSLQATTYEDLRLNNDVLMQQVKIYEEDFNKERADKEKIRKEKEELQQIIQGLRMQLQINNKPNYQWYVPGRLPPDVRQKDTGPSLKQYHKPK